MKILQTHPQLNTLGITSPNRIYWQLNTPQLYEEAVQRHEGYVAHLGPLAVRTGNQTSLAHSDRYIVAESATQGNISWGEVNRPFDSDRFDRLLKHMTAYFQGLDVFIQDGYVRSSQTDVMGIRVITETAWHNLYVRNNYIPVAADKVDDFAPEYTILHAPGFRAIPERDGVNSDVFVIIHLTRNLILIGGTSFAGEIQKAIFSVMNYLLPRLDVLSMECSSNVGDRGDVALFLGIDGAGKTALATDSTRMLLGDSEHGWNDDGIFSIGRGGYARVLDLNVEDSIEIWRTTRRFGTILENVVVDPQTRHLDLTDDMVTENTRASYPISHILNATRDGTATHPQHIIMLAKDVFGVLPPVSKLTVAQAQYYFLTGYTGAIETDRYGDTLPQAKFSACFGAPFMPLHPGIYSRMFFHKIRQYNPTLWLVNTGWAGGSYGEGKRIPLGVTRHIVNAMLNDELDDSEFVQDTYFGLMIPTRCPGVASEVLNPINRWNNKAKYGETAKMLIGLFDRNLMQYQNEVDPAVLAAQPQFD
jgi:phosphoenolpyruvate carboxykinase (ATP)